MTTGLGLVRKKGRMLFGKKSACIFDIFLRGGGKNIACIVDVAAGYCGFINHIPCNCRKYALDVNPDVKKYAGKGVNALVGKVEYLGRHFGEGTVSLFFMSNLLEHLTKDSISHLLELEYRLLEKGGQVWILTPNIRYVGGKYWDFMTTSRRLQKKR